MPSNISVSTPVQSVAITENSYNVSVVGDTATVSVSTTTPQVSVVESTSTFTINTVANKADIGLGNVDNTSDADKPISTATQTALDAKLNKSGGTMTGSLTLAADPTQNLQAATKGYVDGQVNAVPVINSTDDVAEGSINLYYTSARANSDFDTRLATKSTTNVAEGTNQYFTTARARSSVSGTGSIAYNSTTGVISYTGGSNPTTTDELPEGLTNKYYTTARANTDFDTRLATKTTTNLNEGTNLYYTTARVNSDFDIRLATKSTTNLAEGTNLYYTTARSNTDFDGRLATKSTSNLAEGTNLYYTSARANSDFDTRLATKTTDNLSQGTTNKYYSDTLARNAVSAGTGISYNNTTGAIAVDTSTIATRSYADSAAASAAAAVVDAAPATLDTLNELAAALGDDPNFATTISTSLGNKLNTGDFNSTADGWLAGKTTTNVAEGTNLYYTDTRARGAISAVGSLSYNSTTGVISYTTPTTDGIIEGSTNLYYTTARARSAYTGTGNITVNSTTGVIAFEGPTGPDTTDELTEGSTNLYFTNARARSAVANGVDLAVDGSNNVYVKTIRNGTYVLGEMQATRNTAFIDPPPNTSEVSGQNGFEAVSSGPDAGGSLGYSAGFTATYYHGETDAGSSISPTFTTRASAGTNAGGGGAVPSSTVLGTFNFNGHSGTGFASYVATQNGGGGKQTLNPLQLQGYTTQAFAESTISLPTTATTQSNLTIAGVVSSGSGVFTNTSGDIRQYDVVRVTGTLTGSMSFPGYVSGNIYYVTAGANPTTTFTLSDAHDGTPIATTAGTTNGLTFTRHRSIITFAAQTFAPFGFGSKITVAGITPTGYNGTHRAVFGSTTQVGYGNYQTGTTQTVAGTVSIYNVTAGGTGFRVRGFPDSASYNNTNRINFINHSVAACTYRSDSFTWQGGTNSFNYMVMNAAGATFNTGSLVVKDLAGTTTYATIDSTKVLAARPVRYVSTAGGNFAGGSTYTPAATVTNSISTAITSGSGGFTIALTNLLAANEGGHYQVLVSNTSGSAQQVTTTGGVVNINHNLANGSSMMITVYIVNTSAFCEHIA